MKEYFKITIPTSNKETQEILIALLAEEQYDSFEESDNELAAFIAEEYFNEEILKETLEPYNVSFQKEQLVKQNWNQVWESNFQPVNVDDFVSVRAEFHPANQNTEHEIVITPKMSFGTGHHATTHLVLAAMRNVDFSGKTVIDFGTGTGILAIMAEKLGAEKIHAIDIDDWSVENTNENIERNGCNKITVALSENLNGLPVAVIILANINRHILLEHMPAISEHLQEKGVVILSGLLSEDEEIISESIQSAGLFKESVTTKNNWISIICTKK